MRVVFLKPWFAKPPAIVLSALVCAVLFNTATLCAYANPPTPILFTDDNGLAANPAKGSGGLVKFRGDNPARGRQTILPLTSDGNNHSVFGPGVLTADGLGEPSALEQAIQRYIRAAAMGNQLALLRLAVLYNESGLMSNDTATVRKLFVSNYPAGTENSALSLKAIGQPQALASTQQIWAQADKLESQGKFKEAASLLTQLTAVGYVRAQTRLASFYELGRGVPKNIHQAAFLFTNSAEKGDAQAQYAVSNMFKTGIGKTKDDKLSLEWLKKSAAQGYTVAQQALADKQALAEKQTATE